jgi:hypothetical protein
MVVKKVYYNSQKEAEDSIDFDPQAQARSTEIEQPKNKPQMMVVGIPQIQMKDVKMKSVAIYPVKMFDVVIL